MNFFIFILIIGILFYFFSGNNPPLSDFLTTSSDFCCWPPYPSPILPPNATFGEKGVSSLSLFNSLDETILYTYRSRCTNIFGFQATYIGCYESISPGQRIYLENLGCIITDVFLEQDRDKNLISYRQNRIVYRRGPQGSPEYILQRTSHLVGSGALEDVRTNTVLCSGQQVNTSLFPEGSIINIIRLQNQYAN